MGQLHNYYMLLMGYGVTFTPLKGRHPWQLTTYMWQMSRTTHWYTPPWAHAARVDVLITSATPPSKTDYMAPLHMKRGWKC